MQKSAMVALISCNKLLLLKRGDTAPWNPGKYCLPGGMVDENESLIDCAIRELYEETNIKITPHHLYSMKVTNKSGNSRIVFICNYDDLYYVTLSWEHSEYRWASYQDTASMNLSPGLPDTIKTLCHWGYLI